MKGSFNDIFDIAHQGALTMMKIEKFKAFFLTRWRREAKNDACFFSDKENAQAKNKKSTGFERKHKTQRWSDESSTSSSSSENTADSDIEEAVGGVLPSAPKKGRKSMCNEEVMWAAMVSQ